MAISISELLDTARAALDAQRDRGTDLTAATDAAAGLAPIARALAEIHRAPPRARSVTWREQQHDQLIVDLAETCHTAARAWPDPSGRVSTLLGGAADAIAGRAHVLSVAQRWALADALAVTARHCIDAAQQFRPYSLIAHLDQARTASVALKHAATRNPPTPSGRTALDYLIPAPPGTNPPGEQIIDAAAALHNAITNRGEHPRLSMAEALITVNAARLATTHAASLLDRNDAAAAAPHAWQAARIECRGFDDGTKLRPPSGSDIAAAAARLGRALLAQYGDAPEPHATPPPATRTPDPEALDALRIAVGQLPDVAAQLDHAARVWAELGQVRAPERSLLSYEKRNRAVTATDRIAAAEHDDLDGLRAAYRLAGPLTAEVARQLGRLAPGRPPGERGVSRPGHVAEKNAARPSVLAQSAHDALRRAEALHPHEFSAPRLPARRR